MKTSHNLLVTTLLGCFALVGLSAFTGARQQDSDAPCAANLKQMALALNMYSLDYDGKLPPMKGTAFQEPLDPYLRLKVIYTCPVTQKEYVGNPALTCKNVAKMKNTSSTFSFRDAKPHPDGLWTLAYLDGHVKQVKRLPTDSKSDGHVKRGKHRPAGGKR
jgi:hypothetical protein